MCVIHPIWTRDRHCCIRFSLYTLRLILLFFWHCNLWLQVTRIIYSHWKAILSSVVFTADPCRWLPNASLRKIRPTRIKRFLLLIENIRVHSELLQMLLSLRMTFLPIVHTEGTLASNKSPEHLLILLGYPLQSFFLSLPVETLQFMWSYKWKLEA